MRNPRKGPDRIRCGRTPFGNNRRMRAFKRPSITALRRCGELFSQPPAALELRADPPVRPPEACLQSGLWLPPQGLPQARVVRIAASHPLRLSEVMPPTDALPRDAGDHVHE